MRQAERRRSSLSHHNGDGEVSGVFFAGNRTAGPGCVLDSGFVLACICIIRRHDLREDISVHHTHKRPGDKKPQTGTLYILGIAASVEGLEKMRELFFFHRASAVLHRDQSAVFFIGKPDPDIAAAAVFDRILQKILQLRPYTRIQSSEGLVQ